MTSRPFLQNLPAACFAVPPKILRLPDGTLMATRMPFRAPPTNLSVVLSRDDGDTWSDPLALFDLQGIAPGQVIGVEGTVDARGEIHWFLMHQWRPDFRGEGERGGPGAYDGARIDLWHARSTDARSHWTPPRRIWEGYTGSLNSCLTLTSGRIVLPFSFYVDRTWGRRGTGFDAYTFFGMFHGATLCSDDGGDSWAQSAPLKVATPDIVGAYGACEPVAIELRDGRVWMLIRTQLGRFYESFSPDGLHWSPPAPSAIRSSDSPAGLARLDDGRLVLIWNHCLRFPYAYGGRQVIHAALSEDEGKTWRGGREIGWDPHRAEPPPPQGDFGTGYPFPVATSRNTLLISTGQGEGRVLLTRLDPRDLEARRAAADFSNGLDDWSTFGTRGVSVASPPTPPPQSALRLLRIDPDFPAAAVWNFPMGASGELTTDLLLEPGCRGVRIGLADHFSVPYDLEDLFHNIVNLTLAPDPTASSLGPLPAGRWIRLALRWNGGSRQCTVVLDSRRVLRIPFQHSTPGLGYLRLRSLSAESEPGAAWVRRVTVRLRTPARRPAKGSIAS